MNIELEEIIINEVTIEVTGYVYATNEDWANGNVTYFDWCLDIIREYTFDEWCQGWNVDFEAIEMMVNINGTKQHISKVISEKDYRKILDDISDELANN